MNDILEVLIQENKKLKTHNKILSNQISIALGGFEVIVSMGDLPANVAKQTIEAMENLENKKSQDKNKINEND